MRFSVRPSGWDGNSLTKIGAGTLILNAVNTYTGLTDIQVGTLLVDGSTVNASAKVAGSVEVQSGATLGGHGAVGGDVIVRNGCTLSPVSSIGQLSSDGKVTFESGSKYLAEIDGVDSDLHNAREVDIQAGAELDVKILSTADSNEYKIIDTTAGVTRFFTVDSTFLYRFEQDFRDGQNELWLLRQSPGNRFANVFSSLGMFNALQTADGVDRIIDLGGLAPLGDLGTELGVLT